MTVLTADVSHGLVYRTHQTGDCLSRVWYSPCDLYRYGLSREWDAAKPALLFVMLNPSTADEFRNDPTVARCESRARDLGFGGVMIANIFAFRATHPTDLKKAQAPEGPRNVAVLKEWCGTAGQIIASWGAHGGHHAQGRAVAARLPEKTYHLGITKHGHPRHPLYVRHAQHPVLWPASERYAGKA